jgi:hypothetical protein
MKQKLKNHFKFPSSHCSPFSLKKLDVCLQISGNCENQGPTIGQIIESVSTNLAVETIGCSKHPTADIKHIEQKRLGTLAQSPEISSSLVLQ